MGSYEYFRKIETNGNLLTFCQLQSIEYFRAVPVKKNGDIGLRARWTEFAVKSQFSS